MPMSARLLRPRAAVSTAFDPRSISGLQVWLDVSDSTTLGNASTGPGGATANGPIRYIADKSGNGRHATQPGADSVCPTLVAGALGGLSAISFDGGDSMRVSFPVTITSLTSFVVMRFAAATGSFGRYFTMSSSGGGDTEANSFISVLRDGSNNRLGSFPGGGNINVSDNEDMVFMSRHTGSGFNNRKNNGTDATGTSTLNYTPATLGLGTAGAQGRVYEVLFWTRALADAERDAVARYLGRKWGITVA